MEKKINLPRHLDFSNVQLYAVSPDISDPAQFLQTVPKLIEGGIDAIQLRSKKLTDRQLIALGRRVRDLCDESNVLFLMNDRPDLALAIKAHGVHLGQENMPVSMAREIVGHRMIIGASAHSLPQAIEAQRSGADYVSCGPIWATPTKPGYEPVGLKLIGLYKAAIHVPFVAIGGIDKANIREVINAGASTVAIVRGLFDSANPVEAATNFKKSFDKESVK